MGRGWIDRGGSCARELRNRAGREAGEGIGPSALRSGRVALGGASRTPGRGPPRGARVRVPGARWRPSPLHPPGRAPEDPRAAPRPARSWGGGCCDGEAAADPQPRSLSHLRHLGLGPPRAGRSCPGPGPAPAARFQPPAARRLCTPFSSAVRIPGQGPIPAGGPFTVRIPTISYTPLVDTT